MINVKPLCISKWISAWTSVKLRNKQGADTLKSNMRFGVRTLLCGPVLMKSSAHGSYSPSSCQLCLHSLQYCCFFFLLWMHVKYIGKINFKVCVPALCAWGILHADPQLIVTSFIPDAREMIEVLTHHLADSYFWAVWGIVDTRDAAVSVFCWYLALTDF